MITGFGSFGVVQLSRSKAVGNIYVLEFLSDMNLVYVWVEEFFRIFFWLVSAILCSSVVGLFSPVFSVWNLHT